MTDSEKVERFYSLFICSLSQGRGSDAIGLLDDVLELDPKFARAWFAKGIYHDAWGETEDAAHCFTKATEVNPAFADAWYERGIVLSKLANFAQQLEGASRESKKIALLAYTRGIIFDEKMMREAIACLKKSAELFKDQGNEMDAKRAASRIEELINWIAEAKKRSEETNTNNLLEEARKKIEKSKKVAKLRKKLKRQSVTLRITKPEDLRLYDAED